MSCSRCEKYLGAWRGHGPEFPHEAWIVVESQEFEVGTHASVTVMTGVARCRECEAEATFGCSYGEGYSFSPRA
jgi:hypothetical protein